MNVERAGGTALDHELAQTLGIIFVAISSIMNGIGLLFLRFRMHKRGM